MPTTRAVGSRRCAAASASAMARSQVNCASTKWAKASLALWLVATYAFGTRRSGQEIVRVVGVGYLPYVLLAAIPLFALAPVVAGLWFVAILTVAVQVLYGFPLAKAGATAVLAVAVWVLFILLLL